MHNNTDTYIKMHTYTYILQKSNASIHGVLFKGIKYSDVNKFHKKCLFLEYTKLYMYILFTITVQTYNIQK